MCCSEDGSSSEDEWLIHLHVTYIYLYNLDLCNLLCYVSMRGTEMSDLIGCLVNPFSVQDAPLQCHMSCFSGKGVFILVHHVSSYLIYHLLLLLVPSLFNLFLLRQIICRLQFPHYIALSCL